MDFYVVLGVPRTATVMDVKRAYRKLARRFHPDINPGDHVAAARFKEITEAYETLSDPERRRRYDVLGYQPEAADPSAGFEGFDFSASVHTVQEGTFGDLFAEVFTRERHGMRRTRGADLHATLPLQFEEALRGAERPFTMTRQARCEACGGAGTLRGPGSSCTQCHGTGQLRAARGHMVFSRACPRCQGSGVQRLEPCRTCGGIGLHARSETVMLRVPAGAHDGARLRLADLGHAGPHGGPPGDLYVTLQVSPDARFRREGDDLHVVLPLAVHEAALGARIEVDTPDGRARVRVPPGTQSGQRFRLRGRGAPSLQNGHHGDLVIETRIMLPPLLDERSKELLREFGAINGSAQVRPEPAADAAGHARRGNQGAM
jgi:molecular chaperone DnaJ